MLSTASAVVVPLPSVQIPSKYALKNFAGMDIPTFFFSPAQKYHWKWQKAKEVIVSSTMDVLYVSKPDGTIRRSIHISLLSEVLLKPSDNQIAIRVPSQYDLCLLTPECENLAHVLKVLFQLLTSRDLPVTRLQPHQSMAESDLQLARPPGAKKKPWLSRPEEGSPTSTQATRPSPVSSPQAASFQPRPSSLMSSSVTTTAPPAGQEMHPNITPLRPPRQAALPVASEAPLPSFPSAFPPTMGGEHIGHSPFSMPGLPPYTPVAPDRLSTVTVHMPLSSMSPTRSRRSPSRSVQTPHAHHPLTGDPPPPSPTPRTPYDPSSHHRPSPSWGVPPTPPRSPLRPLPSQCHLPPTPQPTNLPSYPSHRPSEPSPSLVPRTATPLSQVSYLDSHPPDPTVTEDAQASLLSDPNLLNPLDSTAHHSVPSAPVPPTPPKSEESDEREGEQGCTTPPQELDRLPISFESFPHSSTSQQQQPAPSSAKMTPLEDHSVRSDQHQVLHMEPAPSSSPLSEIPHRPTSVASVVDEPAGVPLGKSPTPLPSPRLPCSPEAVSPVPDYVELPWGSASPAGIRASAAHQRAEAAEEKAAALLRQLEKGGLSSGEVLPPPPPQPLRPLEPTLPEPRPPTPVTPSVASTPINTSMPPPLPIPLPPPPAVGALRGVSPPRLPLHTSLEVPPIGSLPHSNEPTPRESPTNASLPYGSRQPTPLEEPRGPTPLAFPSSPAAGVPSRPRSVASYQSSAHESVSGMVKAFLEADSPRPTSPESSHAAPSRIPGVSGGTTDVGVSLHTAESPTSAYRTSFRPVVSTVSLPLPTEVTASWYHSQLPANLSRLHHAVSCDTAAAVGIAPSQVRVHGLQYNEGPAIVSITLHPAGAGESQEVLHSRYMMLCGKGRIPIPETMRVLRDCEALQPIPPPITTPITTHALPEGPCPTTPSFHAQSFQSTPLHRIDHEPYLSSAAGRGQDSQSLRDPLIFGAKTSWDRPTGHTGLGMSPRRSSPSPSAHFQRYATEAEARAAALLAELEKTREQLARPPSQPSAYSPTAHRAPSPLSMAQGQSEGQRSESRRMEDDLREVVVTMQRMAEQQQQERERATAAITEALKLAHRAPPPPSSSPSVRPASPYSVPKLSTRAPPPPSSSPSVRPASPYSVPKSVARSSEGRHVLEELQFVKAAMLRMADEQRQERERASATIAEALRLQHESMETRSGTAEAFQERMAVLQRELWEAHKRDTEAMEAAHTKLIADLDAKVRLLQADLEETRMREAVASATAMSLQNNLEAHIVHSQKREEEATRALAHSEAMRYAELGKGHVSPTRPTSPPHVVAATPRPSSVVPPEVLDANYMYRNVMSMLGATLVEVRRATEEKESRIKAIIHLAGKTQDTEDHSAQHHVASLEATLQQKEREVDEVRRALSRVKQQLIASREKRLAFLLRQKAAQERVHSSPASPFRESEMSRRSQAVFDQPQVPSEKHRHDAYSSPSPASVPQQLVSVPESVIDYAEEVDEGERRLHQLQLELDAAQDELKKVLVATAVGHETRSDTAAHPANFTPVRPRFQERRQIVPDE